MPAQSRVHGTRHPTLSFLPGQPLLRSLNSLEIRAACQFAYLGVPFPKVHMDPLAAPRDFDRSTAVLGPNKLCEVAPSDSGLLRGCCQLSTDTFQLLAIACRVRFLNCHWESLPVGAIPTA